jgi:hypothetical protein
VARRAARVKNVMLPLVVMGELTMQKDASVGAIIARRHKRTQRQECCCCCCGRSCKFKSKLMGGEASKRRADDDSRALRAEK